MDIKSRILSRCIARDCGCIEWTGAKSKFGYGMLSGPNNVPLYAHREIWSAENGKIPKGKCVLHKCDNPSCVNINHLFLGSRSDNVRDAISKGRFRYAVGEDAAGAKLTEEKVRKIRSMHSNGVSQSTLAKMFDVNVLAIFEIVHFKTWRHIS